MRNRLLIFIILSILATACTAEMRQTFGEIFELSAKLGEKFKEDSPNVSIGQKGIAITFVNSSFNNLSVEEKKMKAREIALFVVENYPKIARIEDITISFGIYKNFLGFEYKNNLDFYRFKVKDLRS